jgi:hypothetical protein
MNISFPAPKRNHGSVLIVSLLISAIIGITLASYLIMTQAQNATIARSQIWNTSITVAEAGVEDALALLNKYSGDYDQITNWSTSASLAADNWETLAANTFHVKRYLGSNYYDVYITNINNTPIINSIGAVPWSFACNDSPQTMLAVAGLNQTYTPKLITRKLEVRTKFDSLFSVAMAAIQTIDLKGNDVATDSFDSADPAHSINGLYPFGQPSMVNSNGDVCSDATIINSISVGNANIKGTARTGPNGTVYVGPQGYVTGGTFDDFNVVFPNVVLPTTTWLPGTVGNYQVDGYQYDYKFLTDDDYTVPGNFSNGIFVGTNAHVRLKITSSVTVMNLQNDGIRIAQGGSLTIYMLGTTFKIAGRGVVNDSGNAAAFSLFGLPTCTDLQFNGNAAFTGAIYCPQATFSLGGGGNNVIDFIGASVTKTVTMNGHFNFHYDENLRRVGAGRGYVATNWKEN